MGSGHNPRKQKKQRKSKVIKNSARLQFILFGVVDLRSFLYIAQNSGRRKRECREAADARSKWFCRNASLLYLREDKCPCSLYPALAQQNIPHQGKGLPILRKKHEGE